MEEEKTMLAKSKDVFSTFSKSGEGSINLEDVGAYIRSVGFNPSESDVQEIQDRLAQSIDDENVTFQNIWDIMKSYERRDDSYEDLLRAFHYFDPDNTGYIMVSDFRRMMMTRGEPLNEEEMVELLKHANVDKKGKIKYVYFAQRLSQHIP